MDPGRRGWHAKGKEMTSLKTMFSLALAGALTTAAAVSPSFAASIPSNTASLKAGVPATTTEVRWRRGWGWGGFGIGLGLGLAGAAIAAPYYGYGYGYGCGYPYYGYRYGCGYPGYGYAYAPSYGYAYAPSYGYAYAPSYAYYGGWRGGWGGWYR